MDDTAPGRDGEAPDPLRKPSHSVVEIAVAGEAVLDVTFETSPDAIRAARKTHQAAVKRPGAPKIPEPNFSPSYRVAYRVELPVLRKHSKYFDRLLGNEHFAEARLVRQSLADIRGSQLKMEDVEVSSLPWISITDDDEATKSVGRDKVFEDMLRVLHGLPARTGASMATMLYVTTLAILADRFDCQTAISRYLSHGLKFRWPMTSNKPLRVDGGKASLGTEQVLRQKILASWLLEQPLRLAHSTREIIMRGSSRWSTVFASEDTAQVELWWHLPDDLEAELQYRREAILNTIASVQRHFLALYSSRDRQCKLGYDSSAACDSFQLGQMLRFLTSKNLMSLVDYGPSSLNALPDASTLDIEQLLAILRQCPNYQLDKHHTNCGLRTRLEPIVDYIQAMLSSSVVAVSHAEWKGSREICSWVVDAESRGDDEATLRRFLFTRGLASDQRLRYEGSMHADKMSKALFTADSWDWSPEY